MEADHKKYYSHQVLTDNHTGELSLFLYDFWQTFSPKKHLPTTHGKRDVILLAGPDELAEWIDSHPDYEEAPPVAWEKADWQPYFPAQVSSKGEQ